MDARQCLALPLIHTPRLEELFAVADDRAAGLADMAEGCC